MIQTTSSEKTNTPTESKDMLFSLTKKKWGKKEKISMGIIVILFLIILISINGGDKELTTTSPTNKVSYETIERWEIPNGGEGKRIIIPTEFQNEEDLLLICDKVENDVKNDRNAFVLGFANMESLELEKNNPGTNNVGFILNFTKNANTGYHKCAVYYGTNTEETKIKEY